jgi:hypothetical protein
METILFLGIIVRMIACILAQMIKSLYILQYRASALGECQEFVQLPLQQSFWNVMCDSSITCKLGILFVSVKYVLVSVKLVCVCVKLLKI